MLGLSRSAIVRLVALGFVKPKRGPRQAYLFSFQDVVLLRTAHELRAANIPGSKITRSLRRLKDELPTEAPLSGLRITAVGSEIAVRDGAAQWQVDSGQLLMDFDVVPAAQGPVQLLTRRDRAAPAAAEPGASDWFRRGVELEASDAAQAEHAYRRAIELAPDDADPYLNLVALLCDAGRATDAIELSRQAVRYVPAEPLVHFNLAVALEDAGQPEAALASYEACIRLAPELADAHYNAARLHERLGHSTRAIRHYSEYRRLQRADR